METASTLALVQIDDVEGEGECSHCGRPGLRWIAVLSDGSRVGVQCARKLLGIPIAKRNFEWVAAFDVVATHVEHGVHHVLWRHKTYTETRETRNGILHQVGGAWTAWRLKGWV